MKIQYCSDLHLEFIENKEFLAKYPIKPEGDILVLAGDIWPLGMIGKKQDFFEIICGQFETVYWVPGNHEYYWFDVSNFNKIKTQHLPNNFRIVNNQVFRLNDVNLIFTTLWSKISPKNQLYIEKNVSDFSLIKMNGERFTAEKFNRLHTESLDFLSNTLQLFNNQKNIVISHHVPTLNNYPVQYRESTLNSAFAVELFDFICENNILYWIFGHHHVNVPAFKVGNTQLVTNQLGYIHMDEQEGYRMNAVIEV